MHFYDDCRVLRPAYVDEATGYRYYSPSQAKRARLLRSLREAGLPLADVTAVLDGPEPVCPRILERYRSRMRGHTEAAHAAINSVLRSFCGVGAATEVRLGGIELASAVRQVVSAVADDPEHPILGCALVEFDDGEARCH